MSDLPAFEERPVLEEFRRLPVAVHEDWSALVTPQNPARAGEIIHLYMTGLGPTEPPAATGMPSPSDPPAQLTKPLHCEVIAGRQSRTAEVLWAGLAPTFFGVYQVSLRLPPDFGQSADFGFEGVSCGGPVVASLPAKKP